MAYVRDIKYITIDISKASVIDVQFDINSILFIRSIFIKISIRYIKFYIVKANIFILFSITDINSLGFYFNNIDNLLILKNIYISVICYFNHSFLL